MDYSPLVISLKIALIATFLTSCLSIYIAYLIFFCCGKKKFFLDSILTLPLVLPPTVVGFFLLLIFSQNNLVGKILNQLNISIVFSWWGGVVVGIIIAFPLVYKIILNTFEQIDVELIEIAQTLGANQEKVFWQILLPLSWKGILAGIILGFARVLGEFGATFMVAGNIPGKTQTMAMAIFIEASAGNMNRASIWVILTISIALLVLIIINYYSFATISTQNKLARWVGYWLINHDRFTSLEKEINEGRYLSFNLSQPLTNFSLEVKGEIKQDKLGLLGASGAGKSMMLKFIAGIETPLCGQIILNQQVLFDSEKKINVPCHRRKIGIVTQNYALFPHLTVAENIAFGLQDISRSSRQDRIEYYLNLVELSNYARFYPEQLSGGQKQRVALARALVMQPSALLLDEPLSALDTYLRFQIEQLLSKTLSGYNGVTIFVTHKLEEAYRLCDRLMVLSEGKVIAEGAKTEIFERPPNYMTARLTECKNFSSATVIDENTIEAHDWNCHLKTIEPVNPSIKYVGFRAHHFAFPQNPQVENTFPCWLVKISETQHRVTLFLRINSPVDEQDENYHVQAEVYREKWSRLKTLSFPWYVCLSQFKLILLSE